MQFRKVSGMALCVCGFTNEIRTAGGMAKVRDHIKECFAWRRCPEKVMMELTAALDSIIMAEDGP